MPAAALAHCTHLCKVGRLRVRSQKPQEAGVRAQHRRCAVLQLPLQRRQLRSRGAGGSRSAALLEQRFNHCRGACWRLSLAGHRKVARQGRKERAAHAVAAPAAERVQRGLALVLQEEARQVVIPCAVPRSISYSAPPGRLIKLG